MQSTKALWFSIETTFRDIQELCVNARAAQLAQERAKAPAPMKRTMVSGAAMADDLDEADGPEDPRLARAVELSRDLAFREENAKGPDLVSLRAHIRKRLVWLRGKLAEVLSDHDVYHALFPIVVYVDELVQIGTRGESGRWEPLQGELYDVDNGGELFFTILDERLRQQETHPVVLEVFYFCLSDGFTGMYAQDTKKLEEYRERLVDRIALKPIEAREGPARKRVVELVRFPWQYYVIAAGTVALVHMLFTLLSPTGS